MRPNRIPIDPNDRPSWAAFGVAEWNRTLVYCLSDEADRLLYVGVTRSPRYRWEKHARKSWWPEVAFARVFAFRSREHALHVERRIIRELRPAHNIAQAVREAV